MTGEVRGGSSPDDQSAEKVADAIAGIYRASRKIYYPVREKDEITPERYRILRTVYEEGEKRISDIASRIGITPSPVTISVKWLDEKGLVRRERNSGDERVVRVSLTPKGRRLFESLREARRRAIASMFDPLSEAEKVQLLALLDKVSLPIAEEREIKVAITTSGRHR